MKRIVITGGSRGLGLAVCARLLADGRHVVTCARKTTPELERLLEEHPSQLTFHRADLSLPAEVARFARASGLLDGVDGFVANAATGTEGLLALAPDRLIQNSIQLNLVAPMLLAREAIKGMLGQGGNLIFISSVAAVTGLAGLSVYAAAKGGLVSFSRALAREYGERGIRSNCILPGYLDTEMTGTLNPEQRAGIQRRTALKQAGQPADVTGAVAFLLSDQARFVTGAELIVDGGFTA